MEAVQAKAEVRRRGIFVAIFPGRSAGIERQPNVLRGGVGVGVQIKIEARVLRNGRVDTGENKGAQDGNLQGETEAIDHHETLLHTD